MNSYILKRCVERLIERFGIRSAMSACQKKINGISTVRINNVSVLIPRIYGITCQSSEPWMVDLLLWLLRRRTGTFLDIGVNLGQTLIKVKAIDPERKYIGFEPNSTCVFYVQNLIRLNGFKNCTVVPVGLFNCDAIQELNLYSEDQADSAASIIKEYRPWNKIYFKTFVPMFCFTQVEKIITTGVVSIIKIDVEGSELEVVESLAEVIARDRPIMLVEVLPVYSIHNVLRKNRQEELERIVAAVGYVMWRVVKTGSGKFAGIKKIETIGIHSDLSQCDYLFMPEDYRIVEYEM